MNPYQEAVSLVETYMPFMYCYMGSGMLSNSYDEKVAKSNAKACSIIAVDLVIDELRNYGDDNHIQDRLIYWQSVKNEINQL